MLSLHLEKLGAHALPPSVDSGPGGLKGVGAWVSQDDSDCSGVAKHDLVLGSSRPIGAGPTVAAQVRQSFDSTAQ